MVDLCPVEVLSLLKALRLGCEAFASDLNRWPVLMPQGHAGGYPRHGPELAEELRRVGKEIKDKAERKLAEFYPERSVWATPLPTLGTDGKMRVTQLRG